MVAIKNFEKPNECYQCKLLDEHGVCSITGNDIFADCPLVEIEERKVGKWIPVYQGDEIIDYRCSECEYGNTFGKGIYGMNYCPNCGSKMSKNPTRCRLRGSENE